MAADFVEVPNQSIDFCFSLTLCFLGPLRCLQKRLANYKFLVYNENTFRHIYAKLEEKLQNKIGKFTKSQFLEPKQGLEMCQWNVVQSYSTSTVRNVYAKFEKQFSKVAEIWELTADTKPKGLKTIWSHGYGVLILYEFQRSCDPIHFIFTHNCHRSCICLHASDIYTVQVIIYHIYYMH